MSLFLPAAGHVLISLWALAYGECDALNLLQHTSTGVEMSGQTQRLERKMFLCVCLAGAVQGLEVKLGRKERQQNNSSKQVYWHL